MRNSRNLSRQNYLLLWKILLISPGLAVEGYPADSISFAMEFQLCVECNCDVQSLRESAKFE